MRLSSTSPPRNARSVAVLIPFQSCSTAEHQLLLDVFLYVVSLPRLGCRVNPSTVARSCPCPFVFQSGLHLSMFPFRPCRYGRTLQDKWAGAAAAAPVPLGRTHAARRRRAAASRTPP